MAPLSKLIFLFLSVVTAVKGFATGSVPSNTSKIKSPSSSQRFMADAATTTTAGNAVSDDGGDDSSKANYLVNLHDNKETFDFCGGMLFQLVLTDALREHFFSMKSDDDVTVYENTSRMHMTANYSQTSQVDNRCYFHGREIRNVPDAAGGMGMVLQLSLANNDPEGWTPQERERYDGWGHDSGREWRKGTQLVQEGFTNFQEKFGPQAYSLHHRFYLHRDVFGRLWLAAEDGCEGTPKPAKNLSNLFGLLK
jgi:hypothetical protein